MKKLTIAIATIACAALGFAPTEALATHGGIPGYSSRAQKYNFAYGSNLPDTYKTPVNRAFAAWDVSGQCHDYQLTLKDAAERAGCSTKTLRNRIKSGGLMKGGKHGPTYFVPEAELVRMLAMEAPGGRTTPAIAGEAPAPSTVPTGEQEGSSTVPAQAAAPIGFSSDLVLRLTDRLEARAQELGRFKAITERGETLET